MLSLRQNQIKEMGRMNKFTPAFKAKVAIDAIKKYYIATPLKNDLFKSVNQLVLFSKTSWFVYQNKLFCSLIFMLFQHKRLLYSNGLILVRLTSLTSPNLTQYNILIHMHLYNNSEVEVEKRFL